jgi:hypothetical protein
MGNGESALVDENGGSAKLVKRQCCSLGVAPEEGKPMSMMKHKKVDLSPEMKKLWDFIKPMARQPQPPLEDIANAVTEREKWLVKTRENEVSLQKLTSRQVEMCLCSDS